MDAARKVLEVRGLVKHYPGVKALDGVDFDVLAGEVHCLVGPNGAGKSTLIKCISGAIAPTAGEIRLEGEPLPFGRPAASLQLGISTIYQDLGLIDDLTVTESVFLGHEHRHLGWLDRAEMERQTVGLLERLGHSDISPRARIRDLRVADQQIVSIARALSQKLRLLIMDEPSAILDDNEIDTMFSVVERLTSEQVGVVYISHRLDEVPRIGDRVTVLTDGRTVGSGLDAHTPTDRLVELMVGHKVEQLFPQRTAARDDVLLDVSGLNAPPHVRDVSFQVHAGEILGIGGLVGAGRTELLRSIYGVDRRQSGEVRVDGELLAPDRPDRAIAAGLGLAPEERASQALLLDWSLAKNVSLADLARFRRGGLLNLRAEFDATRTQLRALGTTPDDPKRIVRELSGGNQQKVVLARWLLHHCRVLLLDEPTRGVDVATKAELYRVIRDLAQSGVAVVVVSSELEELAALCTRVLVMRGGRVVAALAGEATSELDLLRYAVGGESDSPTLEEVR